MFHRIGPNIELWGASRVTNNHVRLWSVFRLIDQHSVTDYSSEVLHHVVPSWCDHSWPCFERIPHVWGARLCARLYAHHINTIHCYSFALSSVQVVRTSASSVIVFALRRLYIRLMRKTIPLNIRNLRSFSLSFTHSTVPLSHSLSFILSFDFGSLVWTWSVFLFQRKRNEMDRLWPIIINLILMAATKSLSNNNNVFRNRTAIPNRNEQVRRSSFIFPKRKWCTTYSVHS